MSTQAPSDTGAPPDNPPSGSARPRGHSSSAWIGALPLEQFERQRPEASQALPQSIEPSAASTATPTNTSNVVPEILEGFDTAALDAYREFMTAERLLPRWRYPNLQRSDSDDDGDTEVSRTAETLLDLSRGTRGPSRPVSSEVVTIPDWVSESEIILPELPELPSHTAFYRSTVPHNTTGLDPRPEPGRQELTNATVLARMAESRERYRQAAAAASADSMGIGHRTNLPTRFSASSANLPESDADHESIPDEERSIGQRRHQLMSGLRDFRDQGTPTFQGLMAQLVEQQNNNRNRMRARGQNRASRAAAATGAPDQAWQRDEDNETVVDLRTREQHSVTEHMLLRNVRNSLINTGNTTPQTYLGPTSASEDTTRVAGGMRDFYRRLELRNRQRLPTASNIIAGTNTTEIRNPPREPGRTQPAPELVGFRESDWQRVDRISPRLPIRAMAEPINQDQNKAKNVLQYLSKLIVLENDAEMAIALAKDLGIDSLADSLEQEKEVDLPLRVRELPEVQYSSWLIPLMSWKGEQKAACERPDVTTPFFTTGPLFQIGGNVENVMPPQMQVRRNRERIRDEMLERRQERAQTAAGEGNGLLRRFGDRWDVVSELENNLNNLLNEQESRLDRDHDGWRDTSANAQARSESASQSTVDTDKDEAKWPVKITLHNINWRDMTVSGAIISSQSNGQRRSTTRLGGFGGATTANTAAMNSEDEGEKNGDMETYFDGHVIDFHTHALETPPANDGYKVGGAEIDLKYWSRLGPFKTEVEKNVLRAQEKKAKKVYENLGIGGSLEEQRAEYRRTFGNSTELREKMDQEEKESIAYQTMTDCLGSQKWLAKAVGEGGWIFMRWKERFFMSSPSPAVAAGSAITSTVDHPRLRTIIHHANSTRSYTTSYTDERHHNHASAMDSAIAGFFYVAMHRISGRIEALYFDCDSQPFQELNCLPEGSTFNNAEEVAGDQGELGIRRQFGSFQFR